MKRINLIGDERGGAGLARDLALLGQVLAAAGHRVTVTPGFPPRGGLANQLRKRRRKLARRIRLLLPFARHDANIMLERLYPREQGTARRNLFIPNPEWYVESGLDRLGAMDAILAKTRHAAEAFGGFGRPLSLVGFTSEDRLDPAVERRPTFLHLPGKSPLKGTLPLLRLWAANPQWPHLTVVYRLVARAALPTAANLTVIDRRLDDAELRHLQNACQFHLCPSATEGYGHYIGEAMSAGAVVVTLDAAPMNELVGPDRGVLVPAQPVGQQNLALLHGYRLADLRTAVERCIAMPADERAALGGAARAWFERSREDFARRLAEMVERL